MIRIAGVNIPDKKRLEVALTSIHGVGRSLSGSILRASKVDYNALVTDLSEAQVNFIRKEVSNHLVEGDRKREVMSSIKRLQDIKSYRGERHTKGLPVRGQRTKTNMRTRKGNKRTTLTSGRRKLEKT